MNFRKDERGQIMVLTALSTTVVFGFMAMAIDVGMLFNAKRKLQNAVDAAATSAAIDYMFNASTTTATAAANAAVTANQISGANVTVHFAPNITSPYHYSAYYVEVIVTQSDPTFFLGFFNRKNFTIAAKAVAGMPGQGNACVIVLDPHASGSMTLQGSFDVSADKCGVVVNSDSGSALTFTGGAGSLTAGYVSVVGGTSGQTSDSHPAPVTGAAPVVNPFPTLTGPNPATDCNSTNTNSGSSYTGTSTLKTANNITCFSNSVTLSNFTSANPLPSGVLVFENGVTLGGTIYSGANGTTFDNYNGAFNVNTGSSLNIVAPTSAPVTSPSSSSVPAGIALMQPSTNSTQIQIQFGASYGTWEGIVYAPSAQLYLQDSGGDKNGGVTLTTDLIVNKLYDKTATLTIHSYTTAFGSSSPLTAVALVE
jgi:Flp pilus assembly protein TadG